jgi:serine/threonine-protein kinase HipA
MKYESEGGPGVQQIMHLLGGSDNAGEDRQRFLKTLIVFWLLGATDGHAKNFSVFLSPGGGYRMTPLYDVVSAQPSLDAKQIGHNRMKLAMALGNSRHYVIGSIAGRHFVQSAEKAGLGRQTTLDVIDDVLKSVPSALENTLAELPAGFPDAIAESIAQGFRSRLNQLNREHDELKRRNT